VEGFDPRGEPGHAKLATAVGEMLRRMLQGETAMQLLASLKPQQPLWLEVRQVEEAVKQEVEAAEAVDMHTHLFPTGHGAMRYGIDALLTYHYLVSEYLQTSRHSPEEFNSLPESTQAECVWEGLFVKATPFSEGCRGVLTTLCALGLHEEVAARDLTAIRKWYAGQDPDMFNEKMMRLARLRYVVTSHDPFDCQETESCTSPAPQAPRYQRALALDKLLEGDWAAVCRTLKNAGEAFTLSGVANFLKRCTAAFKPLFITAATPHDFLYEERNVTDSFVNGPVTIDAALDGDAATLPSAQDVLDYVVLPLCDAAGLPLPPAAADEVPGHSAEPKRSARGRRHR